MLFFKSKQERLNKRLWKAVAKKDVAAATLALEAGAGVNAPNPKDSRYTALHNAVYVRSEELVRLLLSRGGNPDLKTENHGTALHVALAQKASVEIADMLLHAGATLSICNRHGEAALHMAAESGLKGHLILLLESGAAVDLQNMYGETPLHLAARSGHFHIVTELLERGARADIADNRGNLPADVVKEGLGGLARLLGKEVPEEKKAPDVADGRWILTARDEVAHTQVKEALGYSITGIFNFGARSYTHIVRNMQTGAESQSFRLFGEFPDKSMIEEAYAALLQAGGEADETSVSGMPAIKKLTRQP